MTAVIMSTVQYKRVLARACAVFEDDQFAFQWMGLPNTLLGGKTPLELLAADTGELALLNELGRIEHGLSA